MQTLAELMDHVAQPGEVAWIGLRPGKGEPMQVVDAVQATAGAGLEGDRFRARQTTREVTLIQLEHVAVVAALVGRDVDPMMLRRNIAVSGLNLLALKGRTFRVGGALFEYTGLAHPCSKMESALGPGGYNAMRGHGGITARILESGLVRVGDRVTPDATPCEGRPEAVPRTR